MNIEERLKKLERENEEIIQTIINVNNTLFEIKDNFFTKLCRRIIIQEYIIGQISRKNNIADEELRQWEKEGNKLYDEYKENQDFKRMWGFE